MGGRLVLDMPHDDYLASPAVSRSGLMDLLRSPQHYWYNHLSGRAERADTTALKLGTAFHCLLLEPHLFNDKVVVWSGAPRNTKEGKAEYAEVSANAGSRVIIKQSEFDQLKLMAQSIKDQPAAGKLINSAGKVEASFFYQDQTHDVAAKARPDFWREDGIVIDLKTTADASEAEFSKSIANYGYDVQAFMQMEAVERVTGNRPQAFVFIAVEKEPPYACAFYQADEDLLRCGEYRYHMLMEKYAACMKSGKWPGYGSLVRPIGPPEWFVSRLDKQAAEGANANG